MKNTIKLIGPFAVLMFLFNNVLFAQAENGGNGSSQLLLVGIVALLVAIVFATIVLVSDNLIRIKAKQVGATDENSNFSVFPSSNEIARSNLPSYVNGSPVFILKKGFDIKLEGKVSGTSKVEGNSKTYAVQPPNFLGIAPIPKLMVKEGDEVKAGDPVFFDKSNPDIKYTAPVSGEIVSVNRGAKRSIVEVVILADKDGMKYKEFEAFDLENTGREELVNYMMESGVWPLIRQRPFNVIANPEIAPKSIFISTFKSAPLAADQNIVVEGKEEAFQRGLDALNKLTEGAVYLGLDARGENAPSRAFTEAKGVEKRWFKGPHPSGNVGVQIHHVDPIGAGQTVWTLGVQEVITLGNLFLKQQYDAERIVAISGSEVDNPEYVRTYMGANVGDLLEGRLKSENVRIISGDVLSGNRKTREQYLDTFADQFTVIEEGDYYELFGWLLPLKPRPSVSRTYPNFLFPDIKFKGDTNTHGERRAFVVTGQYESLMPMDIYLQQLMKSILVNDFERMEGLGIYELVEEDVALPEFSCTSKQPLQKILREGLDTMREQG